MSISWRNRPSNFHGPLSFLVAHDMTLVASPSTRKLQKPKALACANPSKRARISSSMAKPRPAGLGNAFNTATMIFNQPFQSSRMKLKGIPAKVSLLEALSEEEK